MELGNIIFSVIFVVVSLRVIYLLWSILFPVYKDNSSTVDEVKEKLLEALVTMHNNTSDKEAEAVVQKPIKEETIAVRNLTQSNDSFDKVEKEASEFIGRIKHNIDAARSIYHQGRYYSEVPGYYPLPWKWVFDNPSNGRKIIKRIRHVWYNPDVDLYYGYMDSDENVLDESTLYPGTEEIRGIHQAILQLALMGDADRKLALIEIYKDILRSYGFIKETEVNTTQSSSVLLLK